MDHLRTRRADSAPGLGREEYYGRPPESVVGDPDMTTAAKVLYDAITLDMAQQRTPGGSMANNAHLAFLAGQPQGRERGETWVRRRLAELVRRGHVTVSRNRNISNCPRIITPTAKLRGVRPREADCTQTSAPAQDSGLPDMHPDIYAGSPPDIPVGSTRQECRVDPTSAPGPILYGETESKREQQQDAETAKNGGLRRVVVLPAVAPEEGEKTKTYPKPPTSLGEALADLERRLVDRFPDAHPEGRARKRLGANRQVPPEASRSANPGSPKPST